MVKHKEVNILPPTDYRDESQSFKGGRASNYKIEESKHSINKTIDKMNKWKDKLQKMSENNWRKKFHKHYSIDF